MWRTVPYNNVPAALLCLPAIDPVIETGLKFAKSLQHICDALKVLEGLGDRISEVQSTCFFYKHLPDRFADTPVREIGLVNPDIYTKSQSPLLRMTLSNGTLLGSR